MRTVGIIGGMSWQSSAEYYRLLNEAVARRLGGFHSARCVMLSVDFHEVEAMQVADDWDAAGALLAEAARQVERARADCLLLATNTMHRVADRVAAAVSIPLLHIADATGEAVRAAGVRRVGLLGTRYTMELAFYRERIEGRHGLAVLVPPEPDRTLVHQVIFDELVSGVIRDESRHAYLGVIDRLVEAGAQGVILGCTEIGLLIREGDAGVPLFDSTRLHVEYAVDRALGGEA